MTGKKADKKVEQINNTEEIVELLKVLVKNNAEIINLLTKLKDRFI